MATLRHSSLWERLSDDPTNFPELSWAAWLAADYPEAGVSPDKHNKRWHICPSLLADLIWLYLRDLVPGATSGAKAAEVRRRFSLSQHELLQLADVRDYILAAGTGWLERFARWNDVRCQLDRIEQRSLTDKAEFYAGFGIRADAAQG